MQIYCSSSNPSKVRLVKMIVPTHLADTISKPCLKNLPLLQDLEHISSCQSVNQPRGPVLALEKVRLDVWHKIICKCGLRPNCQTLSCRAIFDMVGEEVEFTKESGLDAVGVKSIQETAEEGWQTNRVGAGWQRCRGSHFRAIRVYVGSFYNIYFSTVSEFRPRELGCLPVSGM